MEKYTGKLINRWVLYNLAMVCPPVALVVAVMLDYHKEKDNLLERIKLISLYEILNYLVIFLTFSIFGSVGLVYVIIGLVLFYAVLCGVKSYSKKDYFSRGFFLGLFSCHFCLAVISSSEDSTARTDDAKWPDIGLCITLMLNRLIYIFPTVFLIDKISRFFG